MQVKKIENWNIYVKTNPSPPSPSVPPCPCQERTRMHDMNTVPIPEKLTSSEGASGVVQVAAQTWSRLSAGENGEIGAILSVSDIPVDRRPHLTRINLAVATRACIHSPTHLGSPYPVASAEKWSILCRNNGRALLSGRRSVVMRPKDGTI